MKFYRNTHSKEKMSKYSGTQCLLISRMTLIVTENIIGPFVSENGTGY